jgi:RES domain-containing protein
MKVYRIVKMRRRASDLSGTGAFNDGGRWNSPGVFALYTSENPALALLEVLVHVDESELPPHLFMMTIEVDDEAPIYAVTDARLPADWRVPDNMELKRIGDRLLRGDKYLAIKAKSAVLPQQYNYILNPGHPDFQKSVRVVKTEALDVDQRLKRKG